MRPRNVGAVRLVWVQKPLCLVVQAQVNLVDVMDRAFRTVARGNRHGSSQPKAVTEEASTLVGTSLSLILTVGQFIYCQRTSGSAVVCICNNRHMRSYDSGGIQAGHQQLGSYYLILLYHAHDACINTLKPKLNVAGWRCRRCNTRVRRSCWRTRACSAACWPWLPGWWLLTGEVRRLHRLCCSPLCSIYSAEPASAHVPAAIVPVHLFPAETAKGNLMRCCVNE